MRCDTSASMLSKVNALALACAHIVLIRKFEAIFTETRWLRHNFRTKTHRLRDISLA
jgi:hypothetical protein